MLVARAIALAEIPIADAVRRGEPAAVERRCRIDARIVPKPGAEELQPFGVDPPGGERGDNPWHGVATVRNKQSIGAGRRLSDVADGAGHAGLIMRIALKPDDLTVPPRHHLLKGGFDHRAVGIVRNERRERVFSRRDRILHDPIDVRLGEETQEIDAARGDIGVGGKGDDRNVAGPRHLADIGDRLGEQRPQNDLGALVERLLRPDPGRLGGAAVVFHQELDVGRIELGNRHFRGIAHRLAGDAGIAGRR